MKKNFINCLYITTTLSLFSAFTSYGQQLERQNDDVYVNKQITGIGSPTIIYHLLPNYIVSSAQDIKTYLGRIHGIDRVEVTNEAITVHFEEIINGQEINMIFDRVEMLYIQVPTKSKIR
ncbi:hypothetical protein [Fluviicola taffensis]|uniref:hypothetical protein n=1 Tax=Fluviicola taffensis TaxID=191579 RepID=UPI003137B1A8